MSDAANVSDQKSFIQRPMPAWIAAGVLGLALGGGGTFQVMRVLGWELQDPNKAVSPPEGMQAMMSGMGGGMGGGGMGGMMGGGGGGMGGGGGAREKRSLTALVGKMELLSKGLHFEFDAGQTAKLATILAELELLEKMTNDEAKAHLESLQEVLSEEQQATLAAIDLPRGGRAGGGGMGGMMGGGMPAMAGAPGMMGMGGPPGGMGGPPGGMMGGPPGGMMGGGGAPDDSNPFHEEANQKRLKDLLDRLQPSAVEAPGAETPPIETETPPRETETPPRETETRSSDQP